MQSSYFLIGVALGALVGSRILGGLEDPQLFFHPQNILYYYEGSTIIGGILGGILGAEIAKWFMRIKRSTGDLLTYPLIIAIAIGRYTVWRMKSGTPTPVHVDSLDKAVKESLA